MSELAVYDGATQPDFAGPHLSVRDGRVFLTLIRTQVAARSVGAPAMPSVPEFAQITPDPSHEWGET